MVYFDNFKVTHDRGRILEENHYYAYGLKIAALSSRKLGDVAEGKLDNQHLYNDKELLDDADLSWYDYGFRHYDPQIGRFPQLDPLTFEYPFLTPYQYASCDPITNIDIDGLEGGVANIAGNATGEALRQASIIVVKHTASAIGTTTSLFSKVTATTTLLNIGEKVARIAEGQKYLDGIFQRSGWSTIARVGLRGGFLGAALLSPLNAGANFPGGNENFFRNIEGDAKQWETVTTDPSQLSDEYLRGVEERVLAGKPTIHDRLYYQEALARIGFYNRLQRALDPAKFQKHHVLPQKFRPWFVSRGVTNIDDYTVRISRNTHLRGVHGKGIPSDKLPGKWNDEWEGFIFQNTNASPSEIFNFAEGLLKRYGLEHLR